MEPEQKERWSFMGTPEQRKFILFRGILSFGLPIALLLAITEYYFNYGFNGSQIPGYFSHQWGWLLFRCLFCGIFFGFLQWRKKPKDISK